MIYIQIPNKFQLGSQTEQLRKMTNRIFKGGWFQDETVVVDMNGHRRINPPALGALNELLRKSKLFGARECVAINVPVDCQVVTLVGLFVMFDRVFSENEENVFRVQGAA